LDSSKNHAGELAGWRGLRVGSPSLLISSPWRFGRGADVPPRRNVRKVFIRFELEVDSEFWVIGKVLILLGFGVGDVRKVFISNR
jgi:hypothetical protein